MNHEISNSSRCYGLYKDEKIIGFLAVIHWAHPNNKKIKKVHRLVIHPDYQGIGLGIKFLNEIAKIYTSKKFDFMITTTAKNLVGGLKRSEKWIMIFHGKTNGENARSSLNKAKRNNVILNTFIYKKSR